MTKEKKQKEEKFSQEQMLKIEYLAISELKEYERNVKIHSKKQVNKLIASIKQFGMVNPILIDNNNTIIAGHGRLQALEKIGYTKIPVIRIEHLSETEIKAYRLADNKIADDASYDQELLKIELEDIMLDELREEVKQKTGKDLSVFDLICHVTFDMPPLSRKERAQKVKKRNYFAKYSKKALLSDWQQFKKGLLQQMFI